MDGEEREKGRGVRRETTEKRKEKGDKREKKGDRWKEKEKVIHGDDAAAALATAAAPAPAAAFSPPLSPPLPMRLPLFGEVLAGDAVEELSEGSLSRSEVEEMLEAI